MFSTLSHARRGAIRVFNSSVTVFRGAKTLNQVFMIGHIGSDADIRGSPERPVVKFSLATNRNIKNKETFEWKSETQWHKVVSFSRHLAEEPPTKGMRVFVQGRLEYDNYVDGNGISRQIANIIANDVFIMNSAKKPDEEQEEYADYVANLRK